MSEPSAEPQVADDQVPDDRVPDEEDERRDGPDDDDAYESSLEQPPPV